MDKSKMKEILISELELDFKVLRRFEELEKRDMIAHMHSVINGKIDFAESLGIITHEEWEKQVLNYKLVIK